MFFQKNLPVWERVIRVCMGVLAALLGWWAAPDPVFAWLAYGTAAVLAMTGFIGFCPMCALAGRRLKRDA